MQVSMVVPAHAVRPDVQHVLAIPAEYFTKALVALGC